MNLNARDVEGAFIEHLRENLPDFTISDTRPGPPDIIVETPDGRELLIEIKASYPKKNGRYNVHCAKRGHRGGCSFWDYATSCDIIVFAIFDTFWRTAVVPLRTIGDHSRPDLVDVSLCGINPDLPQPSTFMNSPEATMTSDRFSVIFNPFLCTPDRYPALFTDLAHSKVDAPDPNFRNQISSVAARPKRSLSSSQPPAKKRR